MKIKGIVLITLPILLHITTKSDGLAGDFGRRYGASSRLLQRPLFFKEDTHKKCITHKKRSCKKQTTCSSTSCKKQ